MPHKLAPHADVPPASGDTRTISRTVNGEAVERTVEMHVSLADFLREDLRLTGTHRDISWLAQKDAFLFYFAT